MKRAGMPGGGWGRMAVSAAASLLGLAVSSIAQPIVGQAAPAIAAPVPMAASTPAAPQLATYAGVPGSGKPTTVAQQPFGLAVVGRYTFVADPINHSVRLLVDNEEIVFAGNGSMAAEGDATGLVDLGKSQLVGPYAVAVGHVNYHGPFQVTAFDVYIADTFANEIRKVRVAVNLVGGPTALKNTQVCTLAGSGTASFAPDSDTTVLAKATFKSPYGLAWDDAHSILYVADTGNNRIRAIHDPNLVTDATSTSENPTTSPCQGTTTATIQTVALPAGLNHPRGLATDAGGRLYIADTYNNVVRLYDPGYPATPGGTATPKLSIVAGSSAGASGYSGDGQLASKALLTQPAGVAVDGQGNLFIADTGNQIVREVGTDQMIRTVAGTPQKKGKSGDEGPAILAQLSSPMAVAVRSNGDLVIADTGNSEVRVVGSKLSSGPTQYLHLEAGTGSPSFAGDGGIPSAAEFASPSAVLSQADGTPVNAAVPLVTGTRYVLDTFNQAVRTYHSADRNSQPAAEPDADDVRTLAGNGGQPGGAVATTTLSGAHFADPMGMAQAGNVLYIADTFNNVVRRVDASSNTVSIFAGLAGQAGYDGDGNAATAAHLSYPTGVAVDTAGDVFIADSYNGVVREVVPNGTIYTVAGTGQLGYSGDGGPATQAGLYFPYGIAVDSATPPNLFIADSFDHRIREVAAVSPIGSNHRPLDNRANNTMSTIAGDGTEAFFDGPAVGPALNPPTTAEFARPWGLAVNQGNIVVADYLNNRIRQLAGNSVTTLAGRGTAGILNPPDTNLPQAGPTPDSGPALSGEVNGPRSVAATGDSGALLIADSLNNRIRWFGLTQAGIQRTQVNFDPTNLSTTSLPQSVSVTSTGPGLLVMGNVGLGQDPEAQNFSLDPLNNTCKDARLEAGSSCSFQVKFQPRSVGTHTGSVTIPNDAIGGVQTVTLSGQATAAIVSLSPSAVSVYQTPGGTSTPAVVTLSNNGLGVLQIQQITIDPGVFFSQSNDCPPSLPSQGSCKVTISLNQVSATDPTAKVETLVVRDNAVGNPVATQTVPLTGSLAQPITSFNRQDLAFAQNVGAPGPPQTFMLVNSGQVPLHLSDIHEDGDFSQTNNCPQVLAPGASCAINVTFVPSTLGERDGYIVVADDSIDSPQRIAVTGISTMPAAQLGPGHLSFVSNVGAPAPTQWVNLTNRGNGPLTIAGIVATGDFQVQPSCPPQLLPGTSCDVGVNFTPTGAGARHGSLVITDDSNAFPGSQQTVMLDGLAHQPIASFSAATLTMSSNLSTSVSQAITMTNTGDAPITVRGIGLSGAAAGDYSQSTACVTTLQPGASCAINVTFTPHATGARGATLTVYDNAAGGSQAVALRGTGTAPRPVLSGSYLNFGGGRVGTPSVPQSVVLFNAGNGALAIGGVTLNGSDFSMSSTCGPRLEAGASCRITVTFIPRATGARSGAVTIIESSGSLRFTLSGVGT